MIYYIWYIILLYYMIKCYIIYNVIYDVLYILWWYIIWCMMMHDDAWRCLTMVCDVWLFMLMHDGAWCIKHDAWRNMYDVPRMLPAVSCMLYASRWLMNDVCWIVDYIYRICVMHAVGWMIDALLCMMDAVRCMT